MSDDEGDRRLRGILKLAAEEISEQRLRWVLLSFASETAFLGAAVVNALGITHAIFLTKAGGYNPGGSVQCFDIPDEALPLEEYRNRLLSRAECNTLWPGSLA